MLYVYQTVSIGYNLLSELREAYNQYKKKKLALEAVDPGSKRPLDIFLRHGIEGGVKRQVKCTSAMTVTLTVPR